MIQAPDFKEKQIFFLEASELPKCNLSLRNENIFIQSDSATVNKIPVNKLLAVFVVGDVTITSKILQKLNKVGASVFLLKQNLEIYATINSYAEGNYLLRAKQYMMDEKRALIIAKHIVSNKICNQLSLLRGAEISIITEENRTVYKKSVISQVEKAEDFASLRGIEGAVSKDFFQAYFKQINWHRRIPRGKIDENNILLDMGYTYLFNFVDSILRLYGFDTYKGIYHKLFFQRKSLACDMMEPFRCIIDKELIKMHNLGRFDSKDFGVVKGQYYLSYNKNAKYSKIFLEAILKNKMEIYNYIRDHYYYILNNENELRDFIIR